jgi:hypothetical protein
MALTPRPSVQLAPKASDPVINEGTIATDGISNKLTPPVIPDIPTTLNVAEVDPLVVEAEAEAKADTLAFAAGVIVETLAEQEAYELQAAMDAARLAEPNGFDTPVTVTAGDLLDMHRMLGYCLRGNQRPTVLFIQQRIVSLLPPDTPLVYREPT